MYEASQDEKDAQLLKEGLRRFVVESLNGSAGRIDETENIPEDVYQKLVETGFHAMAVPGDCGGAGGTVSQVITAIDALATASGAVASIAAMNLLGVRALTSSKSDSRRSDELGRLATGELLSVWSVSDSLLGQELKVTEVGGTLYVNGLLNWVPQYGLHTGYLLVAVGQTEVGPVLLGLDLGDSAHEESVILLPDQADLGLRGLSLHTVEFRNRRLTDRDVLSRDPSAIALLQGIRNAAFAALANGISSASLDYAQTYVGERMQFGVPIGSFQSTKVLLGMMIARLEASRALTSRVAELLNNSKRGARESVATLSTMAKWVAAVSAVQTSTDAAQLHGGYGFIKDYPVERLMRDAQMARLLAGTDELVSIGDQAVTMPRQWRWS
ncbi:acyl-CoA dehydrogenase family protein [Ferrimicrobium acidiphilum]|uniref:Acyl-CoA dehydrogenase n=1 Tax=Ferrimicrobium acidiphilum DSM 19497 TaxID=1121877 RepID=A0A0D8FQM2_9ACTN|nr:acyl-CoA dehydrogenase family protein [Ferrimicrobium acidiphilum]KJE75436.1 acyl-CoA dehydrogenase [Ferrimicrobium acidiphilum DSM 19497]